MEKAELHAPEFIVGIADITVKEGEGATFTCKVKGQPAPEIKWYYADKPIQSDEVYNVTPGDTKGESTLEIPEAFPEDQGVYTVRASNEAGTVEQTALLTVTGNVIS